LTQKLEEVDAQLREAKADRKESERDRRMSEAVEQLKRFFPGLLPLTAAREDKACTEMTALELAPDWL